MKKISMYQIITILLTVLKLTANGLANALPLNGQGTGEISDRFDIFFVPAGYVFSIWGLIYLGLIVFSIYQALPQQQENSLIKRISPAYWIGSIANIMWIFLWHYEIFSLTLIAMISILANLHSKFNPSCHHKTSLPERRRFKYPSTNRILLPWQIQPGLSVEFS